MSICNKVLTKLRKSSLSASTFSTDTYGLLIQQLVNEAKHEIEDSWDWSMLRQTDTVTTDGTNDTFTLTYAGPRSRLLGAYNTSQQWRLQMITQEAMRDIKKLNASNDGHVVYFTLTSDSQITDNTSIVNIWPYSTASESLAFMFCNPQADLSAYNDNLYIPEYPVILLAYAKAVRERGEDGGVSFGDAYGEYEKALSQAIGIDQSRLLSATDWEVI